MFFTVMLAAATAVTSAQATPGSPSELDVITVEAAKIPAAAADIANTVTLIDDAQIERELAQTLQDLVRYEPGVDVVDQGSRFGLSGISIRGIGGNRVKMEVDGVPVSDAFSIGSFSNASRDFVDLHSLKQVEIVRGPASAVFGSDALGGVVSFVTKRPQDVLGEADRYGDVSAGFNSVDNSSQIGLTGAVRSGSLAVMLRGTLRQGAERDLPGVDPLDDDSHSIALRTTWGEFGDGALELALEQFRADSQTDVDSREGVQDFSAAFGFPYIAETSVVAADDRRERNRVSVGQEWLGGVLGTDYFRWRGYFQDSETRQDTFEARNTIIFGAHDPVERDRSFLFEQQLLGVEVNAGSEFELAASSIQLAYGFEFERTDTEQIRDGVQLSLLSGETTNQIGPDAFPVRDFPKSETSRTGAYLQASIELGSVSLLPGVRWDRYELEPDVDSIFLDDNPGVGSASLDENEVSPKLGILWNVNDAWQLYAQYAEGFRAPPVNDVNVGFTNFQFGYTALPNPDLKAESSEGIEAGVRYVTPSTAITVSIFDTQYDDFIESFQVVGFDPINQLLQFQSINVDEVDIQGAEFKGQFVLPFADEQLSLNVSLAYADGEDKSSGQPLNSIAPLNGVVGLDYLKSSGRWGGSFLLRGAQQQNDLDETDGELFSPSGYVVYDATAFWKPTENTRLRAGVYNLSDHQYTSYLDVQGVSADSSVLDRFQQPGRHASIAFDWIF